VISTLYRTVDYFPKQEEIAKVISTLYTTVDYFSQTRGDSACDPNAIYNQTTVDFFSPCTKTQILFIN
jgi:hypothetical protein